MFIVTIIIITIIGCVLFDIMGKEEKSQLAEGCLTGIIGLVVVIFISLLCAKIHPILGIIVGILGLRAIGRNN